MKNNLTLSIKEIVDLKEGRKTLNQITKTHDGTSSGPLKPMIHDFMLVSGDRSYRVTSVYSSEGEEIANALSVATEDLYDDYERANEDLYDGDMNEHMNTKDNHIMFKPVYDEHYGSLNDNFYDGTHNEYFLLNRDEASYLLEKNDEGEFLYRSATIVNKDGTSTTVIKNNNFNEENAGKLLDMLDEMNADVKDKKSRVYFTQLDPSNKLTEEDIDGNIKNYIKNNWVNRIEEECNVKIKFWNDPKTKPLDKPVIQVVDNDYGYDMMSTYLDTSDWGP